MGACLGGAFAKTHSRSSWGRFFFTLLSSFVVYGASASISEKGLGFGRNVDAVLGAGVRDQGSASVGSSARQKILEQPYVPNEIVVRFRAEKVEIATPAGSQKVTEIEGGKCMRTSRQNVTSQYYGTAVILRVLSLRKTPYVLEQ